MVHVVAAGVRSTTARKVQEHLSGHSSAHIHFRLEDLGRTLRLTSPLGWVKPAIIPTHDGGFHPPYASATCKMSLPKFSPL